MSKFYAIRQINGEVVNEILTSWNECKEKVSGVRAEYKSFKTEQEAKDYLGAYVEEEKEDDVLSDSNKHIYYVDGSYMNNNIGWGFIYVKDRKPVTKMCGSILSTNETSRNITGELESAKMAIRHAISNGLNEIYIVNDYQGISSYVTGAWKPDKKESKDYTNWVNSVKDKIKLNFIKTKGHTGNLFNDMVDELAKLGTKL